MCESCDHDSFPDASTAFHGSPPPKHCSARDVDEQRLGVAARVLRTSQRAWEPTGRGSVPVSVWMLGAGFRCQPPLSVDFNGTNTGIRQLAGSMSPLFSPNVLANEQPPRETFSRTSSSRIPLHASSPGWHRNDPPNSPCDRIRRYVTFTICTCEIGRPFSATAAAAVPPFAAAVLSSTP